MILNRRAEDFTDILQSGAGANTDEDDNAIALMALHQPQLVKGIAASLRTLILASFRAPSTQYVITLLRRLNPSPHILRAASFCIHHEYIYSLVCMLNINMGALDLSRASSDELSNQAGEAYHAHGLLRQLAGIFTKMDSATQARVVKRVQSSGALPVSRDTASYTAVMSVLDGGAAGQLSYLEEAKGGDSTDPMALTMRGEEMEIWDSRAEAKRAHADRLAALQQVSG